MFWASWVWGPAAGPKGVSIFSSKMGRAFPSPRRVSLDTPKMDWVVRYSPRIQFIRWAKGMGLIISLMVKPPYQSDGLDGTCVRPV